MKKNDELKPIITRFCDWFLAASSKVRIFAPFATASSAYANHFFSSGFNLAILLNDKLKVSNREIVDCEKSMPNRQPKSTPMLL